MLQLGPAPPTALLERDHEVECVDATLRAAARGEGRTLVVEGAAGMGKSRLLGEAQARATRLGFRVLTARATQLEEGFTFGVVRQLFERPLVEADAGDRERWLAGAAALAVDVVARPPTTTQHPADGDAEYASRHGLYWLACNLAGDAPLALLVDDLQWCDAPSANALAFIARRVEAQPVALVLATRPVDPAITPAVVALATDCATDVVRPALLTQAAVAELISARLPGEHDDLFVRACLEATRGTPCLLTELLSEVAARGLEPTASGADAVGTIVPRGVASAILLRLTRLTPAAVALARALSVLGDGAQVGDSAKLSGLAGAGLETAMTELTFAGVVEPGSTVRFVHPMLPAAIYGDLTPAERERLHRAAAAILRGRGAPAGQVAGHVMHTEPAADPATVALLRGAAGEALALGDASGAATLLSRALDEPPAAGDRSAVLLELGQARARAGAPEAVPALLEIVDQGESPTAIAVAAIELSNMLLFGGRATEAAAILRRARERVPADQRAREQIEIALLGVTCTSAAARREADGTIAALEAPGEPASGALQAVTLATLASDEMMHPRSAAVAADLAERALAAGLPPRPHHAWELLTVAVLAVTDRFDAADRAVAEILTRARARGAALTVASALAHRAFIAVRRGDLTAARADAQAAIELAPDVQASDFVLVLAVAAAVLAGLDRDETPESLRRLVERAGIGPDSELLAGSQLRYASGVLRAAAGNHDAAIEELRSWARDHPGLGGDNPAALAWRSATALSLAELGDHGEARALAADEVRLARAFGAPRAIGIALRAQAIVGPASERHERLDEALEVLTPSPARVECARVLLDLGASYRAAGRRTAAREPLLEALALAARCGAHALERRARTELGAIGVRPRAAARAGAGSLTPSERRVVELAAAGGTNREIAQALFVTEKTVETHLGRSFRKLDVSSRRQLPDVLARAG